MVAGWTALSAACCLYQFVWSTFAVTGVDEPPGPSLVILVGDYSIAAGAVLTLGSIGLFTAGLVLLWRARSAAAAWTITALVSLALEVAYLIGFGVHWPPPNYLGSAVVHWVYLPESAGLAIGGSLLLWFVGRSRWRGVVA